MDTLDSLGGYWQDQFGLSVSQNSAALSPNDEDRSVRVTTLDQVFSQIAKTDRDAVSYVTALSLHGFFHALTDLPTSLQRGGAGTLRDRATFDHSRQL